jgi:hypothetical protein
MNNSGKAGWALVIGAFVWLIVMGKLDLLVALLPLALLVGYGLLWLGGTKTRLTNGIKKG